MPDATLISAVPTPFTETGAVDTSAFTALLENIAESVDAVFVAGTTGEFPALTTEERLSLFRTSAEVLGVDMVIAHIGGGGVHQTRGLLDGAREHGIHQFAAIEPMFFSVDDETTVSYFAEVSETLTEAESLFAYLFPERSGNTTSATALDTILELPHIAGVKLSGAANMHLDSILARDGAGAVFTGDDSQLPRIVSAGGAGIVSGCSSAFPAAFGRLRDAVAVGESSEIEVAQRDAEAAIALVGPSILWLKHYLSATTSSPWASRMVMPAVSPDRIATIRKAALRS